jgi:uncharacterized protein (TIGR03382 family)
MLKRRILAASLFVALLVAGSTANAQVKRQAIINEIKAAFSTWQQVSCSDIRFEYKGEISSFTTEKQGAILVYFGVDASTWIHDKSAYFTNSGIELIKDANMNRGTIAMNAKDYGWSIGAEKNKIDIRTAVLHMIPATTGFYVGSDPNTGNLQDFIVYNKVDHTLKPAHIQGAQYSYFKAGASCTRPAEPPICGVATTPGPDAGAGTLDGGASVDAGAPIENCIYHSKPSDKPNGAFYQWKAMPIPYYVYVPTKGNLPGGAPVGDGGTTPTGDGGVNPKVDTGGNPQTDGGGGQSCTRTDQCPSGQVCTAEGKCVSAGGGGGTDDGCSLAGTGASSAAPFVLLLFGLLLLRRRD